MSAAVISVYDGTESLAHTDGLRPVYVDAFCPPPWNEDKAQVEEFAVRLRLGIRRVPPSPHWSPPSSSAPSPPVGSLTCQRAHNR